MGKFKIISSVLVIISVTQVQSLPRKRLSKSLGENGGSSRLASVLSDYWTDRGFHDTLTDNLMESESQAKDLMLTGDDDISELRLKNTLRIPRGRLTPPGLAFKHQRSVSKLRQKAAANQRRRQRKRLMTMALSQQQYRYPRTRVINPTAAMRKQDDNMEILESVTLIDGGTPQTDGTIKIRESSQESQRKYQNGHAYDEHQISPLNYNLQDDDLTLDYKQQQYHQGQALPQQNPQQQPLLSASFHTMPYGGYPPQGKLSLGQLKQPKSIPLQSMSLNQYQQQLYQQQHPQRPIHAPVVYSTPKPQVVPIFVIPASQKPKQPQGPSIQQSPLPPIPPSSINSPQQAPTTQPPLTSTPPQPHPPSHFNAQLFQQQFQHPFATQPPSQISSLATLTAKLLSGASTIAAATSAAADALAKGELPIPSLPLSSSTSQPAEESAPIPRYTGISPYPQYSQQQFGPNSGGGGGGLLSSASIPSASQILLPTNPLPDPFSTTPRPGVIPNEEQVQEQLSGQPESLANQITRLVETGRKILYFPKGVMDTMDVVLKQMERNPMIAYWGDKFFAKVFGDTSGT